MMLMSDDARILFAARVHFIAMAPAEIPVWFEIAAPPIPTMPDLNELTQPEREQWRGLGDYVKENDAAPRVLEFQKRWVAASSARTDWQRQKDQRRYFAWRWYYADQLLRASPSALANPAVDTSIL